jgi:hypothetical protein
MLGSSLNELTQMNGAKSMTVRARMYTTNDAVTPMLDLHRTSALMIENIINTQDAESIVYVDETEPHAGSSSSKYMTKKVKLANPATGLYVAFDANVPPESNLNVYYKTGKNSEALLFELKPWQIMVPDAGEIPKTMTFDAYAAEEKSVWEQGLYAEQIARYTELFPREQLLILIYEDICRIQNEDTFMNICELLKIKKDVLTSALTCYQIKIGS